MHVETRWNTIETHLVQAAPLQILRTNPPAFYDEGVTDAHLLQVITHRSRCDVVPPVKTTGGTAYHVTAPCRPLIGRRNFPYEVVFEDLRTVQLEVVYLDRDDQGVLAEVSYATELDEEEYWTYVD